MRDGYGTVGPRPRACFSQAGELIVIPEEPIQQTIAAARGRHQRAGNAAGYRARGVPVCTRMYPPPICRLCDLLAREYPHRALTGEAVAEAMDKGAARDRWVRISRAVTAWIRGKLPVVAIDGVIG